jgi:nitrogen-specific signal transduction histidine kinase
VKEGENFTRQNFPVAARDACMTAFFSGKTGASPWHAACFHFICDELGRRMQVTTNSYYSPATAGTKNAAKDLSNVGGLRLAQGALDTSVGDSVEKQFLDYAQMNPMDRMRANILKSMGLTEDDLKNMSPDQQHAVEEKIRQMIEQEFQKNADKKGQLVDVSA